MISSTSSKLASRKLQKQTEPAKLDDEGKVIINPILGANILNSSWTIWFMSRGPGVKISNYLDATKQLESFSTVEEFWHIYTHLKRVDRLPFTSEFQVFRKGVKPMWEDPVNVNGGKWVIRFKRPFKTYSNSIYTSSAANSANNSLATTPTSSHAVLATTNQSSAVANLTDSTNMSSAGASSHVINSSQGSHRTGNQARLQTRLFWEKLLLSIIGGNLAKESKVDTNEITGAVMSVRKDEDILSVWTRSGEHGEGNPDIRMAIKKLLDLPESQMFEFKIHSDSIKEGAQKQALYNNNALHSSHSNNNSSTNLYHHNNHHHHTNHHHHNNHHHNHHGSSNNHSHNPGSSLSGSSLWGNSSQFTSNNIIGSHLNGSNSIFGHSNGSNTSLNHQQGSSGSNNHGNHLINTHTSRHSNLQQLEATASVLRSASPSTSSFASSRFTAESGPISAAAVGSRLSSTSTTPSISSNRKSVGSGSIW